MINRREFGLATLSAMGLACIARAELVVTDHGAAQATPLIVTDHGAAEVAAVPVRPWRRKVLLLSTTWCAGCKTFDRVEKPKLLAWKWKFGTGPRDHIHHIGDSDKEAFDKLCDQYGVTKIPAVVVLDLGKPIAVLQWTEQNPKLPTAEDIVAAYNTPAKAVAQAAARQVQPQQTAQRGGYPSTFVGTEYTVDPPSRRRIIWHLYAEHGGFGWQWLNSLSWPQLLAAHSDLHNGRLQWQLVGRS